MIHDFALVNFFGNQTRKIENGRCKTLMKNFRLQGQQLTPRPLTYAPIIPDLLLKEFYRNDNCIFEKKLKKKVTT